jgi:hypothetical protein
MNRNRETMRERRMAVIARRENTSAAQLAAAGVDDEASGRAGGPDPESGAPAAVGLLGHTSFTEGFRLT